MRFVRREPGDAPPPETVDGAAARLGLPLMGFVRQPSLTEFGVATEASSANGGPSILDSVGISYTLWRNPDDQNDPVNLADISDELRESLDAEPVMPLPAWMLDLRRLMHFPTLSEAVKTTRKGRLPEAFGETAASVLVAHANHILMNSFREERVRGGFPGHLESPIEERHLRPGSVRVDGADVPGLRLDTDPHVVALSADLGNSILSIVVDREHLPLVTLAFEKRASGERV